MSYDRIGLAGLQPVGFQTISLSNSTAVGLNSTLRKATVLDISVETNDVRWRADATNPTLTTGVLWQSDQAYTLYGFNGTSNLKFQRSTGTTKVSVFGWRQPGDPE